MVDLTKQFSKLYDDNVVKIYRFIYLKVESKQVAEDLTSQVFAKGWARFRAITDIKNPTAYLYQIARTEIVDHLRVRTKFRMVSLDNVEVADNKQNLAEKQAINSDLEGVRKALKQLDEDEQNVLIMRYLDEQPFKTIALALDKNEGAIRVMVHRALKKLKEGLGDVTK
ncbi:MAG: RNA polymerase sigma factor [Candidatus Gribaldobacteria bacterium]|nr:RNA polymerase sigma factor [Candidatus Gribaldobacteria bacterium]